MNVAVIADRYLATGYRLAGIHAIPVRNLEEAVKMFNQAVSEKRFEMILIPEEYAEKVWEESKRSEFEKKLPTIAVIPSFKGPAKGRTRELYELVSQAVGTKLKMEE